MANKSLSSIGYTCQLLQRPHSAVTAAVDKLRITPAATINGVQHFDDRQVARIGKYLDEVGMVRLQSRPIRHRGPFAGGSAPMA